MSRVAARRQGGLCGAARFAFGLLALVAGALCLTACRFPGSVSPTVKIGLSAPFEGRYRDEGYEALHAVRLAVRQRNAAGGVGDRYLVELVALNDLNEPAQALVQARKMAVDPGVLGVLGGWSPEVVQAAGPEYGRLGLAFLAPGSGLDQDAQLVPDDAAFVAGFQELSGGAPPGPIAFWAFETANSLLDAIDAAARLEGEPTRVGVQAALPREMGP